jgi:PDZ domain-containing protein
MGQMREVLIPEPAVVGGPVRVLVTGDGRLLEVPPDLPPPFEDGPVSPEGPRPRRVGLGVWLVVGFVFFVAAAAMYHPPYVVISPGTTFEVSGDVSISGVPTTPVNGSYLATSVRLSQPSALRLLVAAVRPDREVLALSDVLPKGVDVRRYDRSQREIFKESQLLAAVAAARSLGMPVTVTSSGARVVDVVRGSPAAKVLQPGDVIVAIDGQPVTQAGTVGEVIRSKPAGSEFRFTIERDGRRTDVTVRSQGLPQLSGGVGIGIAVQSHGLRADLPFSFQVRDRENVGGPSAGLIYALAIADVLSAQDYAGGRTVAATGTIDPEGDVGPVGGVKEKAIAVQRADADVFLVPASEVDQARRPGLPVVGVERLQRAIAALSAAA